MIVVNEMGESDSRDWGGGGGGGGRWWWRTGGR